MGFHNSASVVAYRKSYFEEAGVDTFPETWEELFEVGKILKGEITGRTVINVRA